MKMKGTLVEILAQLRARAEERESVKVEPLLDPRRINVFAPGAVIGLPVGMDETPTEREGEY